jgi:hypothetical protein
MYATDLHRTPEREAQRFLQRYLDTNLTKSVQCNVKSIFANLYLLRFIS